MTEARKSMTGFSGDNRTGRCMGWVEGEIQWSSHGARASRAAHRAILTRAPRVIAWVIKIWPPVELVYRVVPWQDSMQESV